MKITLGLQSQNTRRMNIDGLDSLSLSDLANMPFRRIIPLYEELAFSNIEGDDEIGYKQDGLQLHKGNQYAMQYLMFTINKLKAEKRKHEEAALILSQDAAKEAEIIKKQQEKLNQQQKKLNDIDVEINDQKQLLDFEKKASEENREMVHSLKDQLKRGITSISLDTAEGRDYLRALGLNKP